MKSQLYVKPWLCLAFLLFALPVWSQDYKFSVPTVVMDATVLPNAGANIRYDIEFKNAYNAHPIDIVDVGLPHENYDIPNMSAWVDGVRVTGGMRPSEYVKPGVEVHLGELTIPAGGSAHFQFEATLPDLVFQDTTRKDYASFQITPTWFGEQYVEGDTALTIRVHLPAGLQPDEVLSQDVPFTGKDVTENNVVASWETQRRFTSAYRVGVSFPKRVMNRVVTMTINQLIMRWYKGTFSTETRLVIMIGACLALMIIFARFTGGTGCVLFAPILIFTIILFIRNEIMQIYIWPILVVLAVIVETARRKRKSKYLPAIASVEGGGIKRGLTAPEAAVLLELPLNKIVTMILFGMLKKGLARQTSKDPLILSIESNPPADAIVQPYEKDFLEFLKKAPGKPIPQMDFGKPVEKLIKSVAEKMKGFDLDETKEYYKHIISRAWLEAKTIGDLNVWQKTMDDKIDWLFLDPLFQDRFRPYGTRYVPRSYRTIPTIGAGTSVPSPPSTSATPRFTDIAGSVAGWFQNTAQGVVTKIEGQKGGILDFKSVDKAVGKALKEAGSSSGRSGGGGGCACACAGCACACACAGGGR